MANASEVTAKALSARSDISFLERLTVKIRRHETPFYDRLYRLAKAVKRIEMPFWRPFFRLLYYERAGRIMAWYNLTRVLYYQPVFKARCEHVGKRFIITDRGMPLVMGHLRVLVGDDCGISAVTTFAGSKLAEDPVLEIGDGTFIGHQAVITVGERVTIGKYCMIASRTFIAGADNHPIDPIKRRTEPEAKSSLRPIVIEDDVWVATGSTVYKGVTIGRGSVVAGGSVVTRNVPPYTVVAGNPARVVYRIPRPKTDA
jgi:acetyltransferase-like isoleucine patch superfamily enzyme